VSTKEEALSAMIHSRWENIAALGYQQFKAEGRGVVMVIMPFAPQVFGAKVRVDLDYMVKGGAKWAEGEGIPAEVETIVDTYDPARSVAVGIVHPNNEVNFALFDAPEGKQTPAAAYLAGHAPPRLS
jgi:hypothetical protein